MADFMATCASNHPRLKDHAAVEQVVSRYYFEPEFHIGVGFDEETGSPYLFIYGYCWPEGWRVPPGIAPEDFNPYSDERYEAGAQDFSGFLLEVAPYLIEPLIVQAIGSTRCRYPLSACEWHIQPGAREVQLNEFRHHDSQAIALPDELSEAS